jgi:hypothetical protein
VKSSGAPSVGDLIVHLNDVSRDIFCPGLVVQCRGNECLIIWANKNADKGWFKRWFLKVINEGS